MDFAILLRQKQLLWLSIVALISFFMSEVVIFMLSGESFVVISQVLFFLIVLISLLVPERSIILNVFIGLFYLIFVALTSGSDLFRLIPSMVQFYVFISMSIIISRIIHDIRYNEKKYYGLLENTTRGICIYDSEKRTVAEKNHAFVYDTDLFIDRVQSVNPDFFGFNPESPDRSSTFEIEYESADGGKSELLIFAERLFEKYILLIVTDITENKRSVENSQIVSSLSNALLRGSNIGASSSFTSYAARNISDTCWVGIYLFNEEINAYGLVSSHNLPKSFEESFSAIDPADKIGELIAGGETVEIDSSTLLICSGEEENHDHRSVLIVPVYMTNKPVGCILAVTEKGKKFSESSKNSLISIAHIFGSALKRIYAENEIIIAKSNLESLFESLDDFIFIYNNEGRIIHTNSTVHGKLGYSSRRLEEVNIATVHGYSSFEAFDREIRSRFTGKSATMPFNLVKSSGDTISVEMKIVTGKWGDSEAFFVIDRDVTLRKKHEDEIRSRDAILDAVSIIAENFLRADTWVENINESLERLGRAADVASVCFFEAKRPVEGMFCPDMVYRWVNEVYRIVPDVESLIKLTIFNQENVAGGRKRAERGIAALDKDSASGEDKEILERLNVETILTVPLVVDDSFRGFLCLVEGKIRTWSTAETDAIQIAGEILSSAIKRTEDNEIFRNPIEKSLVGVFHVQDFRLSYVNPKFAELVGYTREELIGKSSVLDLVHEDYRQVLLDTAANMRSKIFEGNDDALPEFHFEIKGIRKDGSLIDVEVYGNFMLQRGELSFIGMAMDITLRKEAEKALSESEALIRLIIDNIPVGIALNSVHPFSFEFYNENFLKFYHITADALSSPENFWSTLFEDPALSSRMREQFLEDFNSSDPERMIWKDIPIACPGGETAYITAGNTRIPGKNLVISTVWDVTRDHKMEEELKDSQQRLAEAMEMAHLVNWECDIKTGIFTFDNRFYALYGTTEEREGGRHMTVAEYVKRFVHPDDSERVLQDVKNAMKCTDQRYLPEIKHRIIRRDGEIRHIVVRFGVIRDDEGRVIKTRGANQDITVLKMAEQKLYESNEMLDLALKSTKLGIYDWNIAEDKLSYTDALFTMLGYSPEDYEEGRMSFEEIIHPDDKEEKDHRLRDHLEGKTPYYETEYRMKAKTGEWRWIAARGEVVERDQSGKAVRITGTHLDITERKTAEEKISHLNRVLKAVRNVNELIVRETDINRLITGASRLLVETRGYLDAWVILTDRYGSYLDSAGSGDREDVVEIIRETKSGNPPKILVDALRTNEIISLSKLMNPGDAAGDEGELLCRRLDYGENAIGVVFGVIIISIPAGLSEDQDELGLFNELASDISFAIHDILLQGERKGYEEQILKSLEEKTVLLQEVHHRVKNNLQIISGLIKMQSRTVEDPSARDSLLRCENRIMAIAMVHEALYRSENLSNIHAREHFINLAQSLIDSLSFTEYKDIRLKTNIEVISLPISIAIPCSLIINEIISNSIKYAFETRDSGEISLIFRSEDENYYLEVADNGVGVPDEFDLDTSKSLGMRLVRRLAVEQLRGTTEIITGDGTRFIFIFPKHPE